LHVVGRIDLLQRLIDRIGAREETDRIGVAFEGIADQRIARFVDAVDEAAGTVRIFVGARLAHEVETKAGRIEILVGCDQSADGPCIAVFGCIERGERSDSRERLVGLSRGHIGRGIGGVGFRQGARAPIEIIVEPDFDDVDALVDFFGEEAIGAIRERRRPAPEIHVIVLNECRPVGREPVLDTATYQPTRARLIGDELIAAGRRYAATACRLRT
jgi:hypothetical protein